MSPDNPLRHASSQETPMLDVHPPHEAAHTWKDFFIHIATIVVGLLIAIGGEGPKGRRQGEASPKHCAWRYRDKLHHAPHILWS